jgi:outer membrane cobalamin receptor
VPTGGAAESSASSGDSPRLSGWELGEFTLEDLLETDVTSVILGKQTADEAPSSLVVIKAADIQRYGFRTLGEAINYLVAGADMLTDHNYSDIGMRGVFGDINANGSSVRVLVDGIDTAFRTTGANAFGLDQISVEAIKQIEIVRGPMSVVYGPSAFLGVVNIITKAGSESGLRAWTGGQSFSGSGVGNVGANGEYSQEGYYFGASAQVSGQDLSNLALPSESLVAGDPQFSGPDGRIARSFSGRSASANVHAGLRLAEGLKLQADAIAAWNDSSAQFQPYSLLRPNNRIATLRRQARLTGTYVRRWLTVESHAWNSHGETLDDSRIDIGNPNFLLFREVGFDVWGGSVRVSADPVSWFTGWIKAEHENEREQMNRTLALSPGQGPDAGLELQRDVINLRPGRAGDSIPSINNSALSGYALLAPFDWLKLSGGARWDRHSIYQDNLSYRLGLVGLRSGLGYAKLIAGRSFKAPTPQQLFWLPVGTADFQGNADLQPQVATSVEMVVGSREAKVVAVQATAFLNLVKDRVMYLQRAGSFQAQGIANARTVGLEVEAGIPQMTFLQDRLCLYSNVALSWNQTSSELDEIQRSLLTSQNVLFPTWKGALVASGEWRPWYLALIARTNLTSDRVASQTNVQARGGVVTRLPGNRDLDLGVRTVGLDTLRSTILHGLSVQLMARNVLDIRSPLPGYNGFEIPRLPRTYELFLRWQY